MTDKRREAFELMKIKQGLTNFHLKENGKYEDTLIQWSFDDFVFAWNASHDRCKEICLGIEVKVENKSGNYWGGRFEMQEEAIEAIQKDKED